MKGDTSLSSLSQSSHGEKDNAQSLSKAFEKQYFVNGECMLKILSPIGGTPADANHFKL